MRQTTWGAALRERVRLWGAESEDYLGANFKGMGKIMGAEWDYLGSSYKGAGETMEAEDDHSRGSFKGAGETMGAEGN